MIAYRDFSANRGWIAADLNRSVQATNDWIAAASVSVINVESIVYPAQGFTIFNAVRVWYRSDLSQPDSTPEL